MTSSRVLFSTVVDRARASLFVLPTLFVLCGAVLGLILLWVDESWDVEASSLPLVLEPTVDSSREVLSTVAAATITVAGIAFSVSLLVIQLASSQYSPRITHGLFRDRFNKRVFGLSLGTFTYCLVVLQAVRDASGGEVVASLSTTVAILLGIASLLAIVAFIDHNAHMLDVSEILQGVTRDTTERVRASWPDAGVEPNGQPRAADVVPDADGVRIDATSNGWVQQVDHGALGELVAGGGVLRLETDAGRYSVAGTPLCTLWVTEELVDIDETAERVVSAFQLGDTRTLHQDASYGIRQLADVGLRALSTGVNDATTAQDAIFHLVAVLREMLVRPPPPAVTPHGDGWVVNDQAPTHVELVRLAFGELRVSAGDDPQVCRYLLEALDLLCEGVGRDHDCVGAIRQEARKVVEQADLGTTIDADRRSVRAAFERRFS